MQNMVRRSLLEEGTKPATACFRIGLEIKHYGLPGSEQVNHERANNRLESLR